MSRIFSRLAIALVGIALALAILMGGFSFTHTSISSNIPVASAHTDIAQSKSNSTPKIIVRTTTGTIPTGSAVDSVASCKAGEVATGGGGAIGSGGLPNAYITATGPFPVPTATAVKNPTAWHVIATNLSGTTQPLTVWVLCAR